VSAECATTHWCKSTAKHWAQTQQAVSVVLHSSHVLGFICTAPMHWVSSAQKNTAGVATSRPGSLYLALLCRSLCCQAPHSHVCKCFSATVIAAAAAGVIGPL
jgi:hypothetical protein